MAEVKKTVYSVVELFCSEGYMFGWFDKSSGQTEYSTLYTNS